MSGNVDTYLEARLTFDERERQLREMMRRAGRILECCQKETERMIFLGTGVGLPWPPGAASHAIVVSDGDWPDARGLQQALADWHEARVVVEAAWDGLPERL